MRERSLTRVLKQWPAPEVALVGLLPARVVAIDDLF
jgi:hypothetical protein